MKNLAIFILSFFVYVSVFAQDIEEKQYFEKPHFPAIKKAKSEQVWWEPDTVYIYNNWTDGEIYIRRVIFEYRYHSQGLTAVSIEQNKSINSWVNRELSTYTYDSNNNMLTKLNQRWINSSWEDYELYTYTYDSNNNRLTELHQFWRNNAWINSYSDSYTYTYDSNNNKLKTQIQRWEDNAWINTFSYTYTYDSYNNMLTALIQNWENNAWINNSLQTYTNNGLTVQLQRWENDSWVNNGLVTYTCDSNNNRLTELIQRWENNAWVNNRQYLRSYDENGNGISVESWRWENENWQPSHVGSTMIILGLYYNNMQSVFEMWSCDKLTASYVNVAGSNTAIVEPSATSELNAVSIYPNPTTGELKVENGTLKIQQISFFDISGVHLFDTQQATFNISHLPAGIYFVKIKTEKGIVMKKLVKL